MNYSINRKAIWNWIIQATISYVCIFIALWVVYLLNEKYDFWRYLNALIVGCSVVIIIVYLFDVIFGPFLRYKNWSYTIEKSHLFIKREGKFYLSITDIPLTNIHSINISQNFISKKFDITKLKVSTLGDSHEVDGLKTEDALKLKEILLEKGKLK